MKSVVGKMERKSEIAIILNKYKYTLDDLINSSDTEFSDFLDPPDWPGVIIKDHTMRLGLKAVY